MKIRGGRARPYKRKGRQPVKKQYNEWYRSMLESGMAPNGRGQMVPSDQLGSQKIKHTYQRNFGV
jgi:hypothetical protein